MQLVLHPIFWGWGNRFLFQWFQACFSFRFLYRILMWSSALVAHPPWTLRCFSVQHVRTEWFFPPFLFPPFPSLPDAIHSRPQVDETQICFSSTLCHVYLSVGSQALTRLKSESTFTFDDITLTYKTSPNPTVSIQTMKKKTLKRLIKVWCVSWFSVEWPNKG